MKTFRTFPMTGIAFLETLLSAGIYGFSYNRKDYGTHVSLNSIWLCTGDGMVLRLSPEMHDLEGWEEVGSLEVEQVESFHADAPRITLGSQWHDVVSIEKLVISEPGYFSAESGLKITNRKQEAIIICNGAAPYELALSTPFTHDAFNPEYDLYRYSFCPVFA